MNINNDDAIVFIDNVWNYKNNEDKSYGFLTLSTLDSLKKMRHSHFQSNNRSDIKDFVANNRNSRNIYSSIGLCFDSPRYGKKGKESDVTAIAGFAIDVDILGPGHKETKLPPTIDDALDVVMNKMPIKPTMIVNSGGGFYPYYLLKNIITIESYEHQVFVKAISSGLQSYLRRIFNSKGWKLDNTSNLDRIFRLPGTFNFKTDTPRLARIMSLDNTMRYDIDNFDEFITDISQAKGVVMDNQKSVMLSSVDAIIEKCSWLKHCRDDAATLSEPEWYASISILCRYEGGEEIIHQWGNCYPGYSEKETNDKIAHAIKDSKPVTCEYVHTTLQCGGCEACPSWGNTKSPISKKNNSNANDDFINKINEQYALVKMDGNIRIIDIVANDGHKRNAPRFYSPAAFVMYMKNRPVYEVDENGKSKKKNGGNYWLESPNRREYEDLTFCPGECDPAYYNLWKGFAIEPNPRASCDLFKKHVLEVIANNDIGLYKYIMGWLAQMVQHPENKPGTSLVLKGEQGTGKGTFVLYLAKIFGVHYLHLSNPSQLVGKFNAQLMNKVLVFADEAFYAGDKSSESSLKMMITEQEFVVEGKGRDAIQVPNHLHLILASNNEWVVPAGKRERRYVVLDVSTKYMQDRKYFKAMNSEFENDGAGALLDYLLKYDYSSIDVGVVPKTQALWEQTLLSSPVEFKFWYQMLEDGANGKNNKWNTYISKKYLYDNYLVYAKDLHVRNPLAQLIFGRRVNELCKSLSSTKKKDDLRNDYGHCYIFPPLETCRQEFEELIKFSVFKSADNSHQFEGLVGDEDIPNDFRQEIDSLLDGGSVDCHIIN
ncbi:primase-helicase family protein [Solidesulfovibrio sp. C21]|uniref:primase-helicase family protein n=1 Tax=Solidesulfovibrio sp. C21 TaxID=3398613 RepID=UPI0039FC5161